MVGWHHLLNGHQLEQALGDGEGQEILACHSPWGCKELDNTTQRLNSNKAFQTFKGDSVLGNSIIYVNILKKNYDLNRWQGIM